MLHQSTRPFLLPPQVFSSSDKGHKCAAAPAASLTKCQFRLRATLRVNAHSPAALEKRQRIQRAADAEEKLIQQLIVVVQRSTVPHRCPVPSRLQLPDSTLDIASAFRQCVSRKQLAHSCTQLHLLAPAILTMRSQSQAVLLPPPVAGRCLKTGFVLLQLLLVAFFKGASGVENEDAVRAGFSGECQCCAAPARSVSICASVCARARP